METKNPSVDLQNVSDERVRTIARAVADELEKRQSDRRWKALGYAIIMAAAMSIGYRLAMF